nr:creatininase family protein [uncultured Lichenicoccus sp.]
MLPTLPYGCSLGHSHRWPGTLALPPQLLTDLVVQIGNWAFETGVRRLFLVNAHVGNAAPLRCALELLCAGHDRLMLALINTATVSDRVREVFFADARDWHVIDAQTLLMLAIAPDLVRPDKLAEADDVDRTGDCVTLPPEMPPF